MSEAEIKPKRRARKAATPEEEAAQILLDNGIAAEVVADAVPDEAPVKKPRASRKKDAEIVAEAPVEAAEAPAETEKPKRSRAKKAEAETAPEPEVVEIVEEPVVVFEASPEEEDVVIILESEDEEDDAPAAAAPRRESRDGDSLTFSDLGLSDAILKSVKDVGYEEPTPIQAITIPAMLKRWRHHRPGANRLGQDGRFRLPDHRHGQWPRPLGAGTDPGADARARHPGGRGAAQIRQAQGGRDPADLRRPAV